jgi:hypothetical protein
MKDDGMGDTCSTQESKKTAYNPLIGKAERKRQLKT